MRKTGFFLAGLFLLVSSASVNASSSSNSFSEIPVLQAYDYTIQMGDVNKSSFFDVQFMKKKFKSSVRYSAKALVAAKHKMKDFLLWVRSYSGTPFAYYNTSYVYINEAVKRFNIDNPVVNVFLDPVSTTMSNFVVIADTFFGCLDNSCGFGAVFEDNYGRA